HSFDRRGVRLINASTLPVIYDSTTTNNTKGFTFASENGVYVWGNYNATGATVSGGTSVTPASNYTPYNTSLHIPAAIIGDAVTILSNNWNDGEGFALPNSPNSRAASDTQVR